MLEELLRKRQSQILAQWTEVITSGYPEQTARFMRAKQDRFNNPVGYAIDRALPRCLDLLIGGAEHQALAETLDRLIQIKSVQESRASVALSFVLELKTVIRSNVARDLEGQGELFALEAKLDQLLLAAFDSYQGYREKILEIKANEIRSRSKILLERMNMGPEEEPVGTGCCLPEDIPVAPAQSDVGEPKGGND